MRPRVTMHMMSSIDGRITPEGWPASTSGGDTYEAVHRELHGDAWLVGRITMAEFAEGEPRPIAAGQAYPRETWKGSAAEQGGPFAVCLDKSGRLHMNRDRVNGDALIAVLGTDVPDHHLAELRRDGISYIFAGDAELDLALTLEILRSEFGIESLLLEGGGGINGAFLGAGLIDEISLMILPVADGKPDAPTTFDGNVAGGRALELVSVKTLDGGTLHLRYRVLPAS